MPADFTRINAPRVAKIEAMITTIRKSARSQKISDDDVAELLAPVAAQFADAAPPTAPVEPEAQADAAEPAPKPRPVWRDPPHILQIDRFIADLPALHLSIYAKHLIHRLCERADDARAE